MRCIDWRWFGLVAVICVASGAVIAGDLGTGDGNEDPGDGEDEVDINPVTQTAPSEVFSTITAHNDTIAVRLSLVGGADFSATSGTMAGVATVTVEQHIREGRQLNTYEVDRIGYRETYSGISSTMLTMDPDGRRPGLVGVPIDGRIGYGWCADGSCDDPQGGRITIRVNNTTFDVVTHDYDTIDDVYDRTWDRLSELDFVVFPDNDSGQRVALQIDGFSRPEGNIWRLGLESHDDGIVTSDLLLATQGCLNWNPGANCGPH